jgi:release factor glutamine methyltransferase
MPDESARPAGTISWRELWTQTASTVGGRPQARWLCEAASGFDGDEFLLELDTAATQRSVAHLDRMLTRLAAGEPLQYVLGSWSFRRLDLMVDRRVLIPRPETEDVAGVAIELARDRQRPVVCADLGTGSGAIGLSLAAELPVEGVTVWLTDVSMDALDVARANIAGIGRGAANVRCSSGSWFEALPDELRGLLDVVVSNPPYVPDDDPALEPIVHDWEPAGALFGGADGLDAVRAIATDAPQWLRPGGWLVLEIGSGQGRAVADLLTARGLIDVEIRPDAAGHSRIAIARRPG